MNSLNSIQEIGLIDELMKPDFDWNGSNKLSKIKEIQTKIQKSINKFI